MALTADTSEWTKPSQGGTKPKGGIDWLEDRVKARKVEREIPTKEDAPGESTLDLLTRAWVALDEDRDRSQQTEIGPSGLGGCRRQTFFKLVGQSPINFVDGEPMDRQGALIGTAVHDHAEQAINKLKDENLFTEITLPGIPGLLADGHTDLYRKDQKKIVDWKTPKKKNLRFFPGEQYRWQGQVYGYLAIKAGYEVEWVEIIGIVKDGAFTDNVSHVERYDEAIAVKALDWLRQRQAEALNGEIPPADYSGRICSEYCSFYGKDLCLGKGK